MGHKDLRLGQIVYILVFYNISLSWLLPLDGFQFIFLLHDNEMGQPSKKYLSPLDKIKNHIEQKKTQRMSINLTIHTD